MIQVKFDIKEIGREASFQREEAQKMPKDIRRKFAEFQADKRTVPMLL